MREAEIVEEEASGSTIPVANDDSPPADGPVHVSSGGEAPTMSVLPTDVGAQCPQQPPAPTSTDHESSQTLQSAMAHEVLTEVRLPQATVSGACLSCLTDGILA